MHIAPVHSSEGNVLCSRCKNTNSEKCFIIDIRVENIWLCGMNLDFVAAGSNESLVPSVFCKVATK